MDYLTLLVFFDYMSSRASLGLIRFSQPSASASMSKMWRCCMQSFWSLKGILPDQCWVGGGRSVQRNDWRVMLVLTCCTKASPPHRIIFTAS